MDQYLLDSIRSRLTEFSFKERGDWLRQGICPNCQKKELYTHANSPWVLRCGRLNNCGYEIHVKELYSDLFDNWSNRFPVTNSPTDNKPANPNAAADAYLSMGRGFNLDLIRGTYTQETYFDTRRQIGSATVRFKFGDSWWQRLIDQPHRFGKMKAYFQPGTSYVGRWWSLPRTNFKETKEIWLVEGIFDAISLAHHGITAVAVMSCYNYPSQSIEELLKLRQGDRPTLVWALDNDKAGRGRIVQYVRRAKQEGWQCKAALIPNKGRKQPDWNDFHLLDANEPDATKHKLSTEGLQEFLHHGALLIAESATEKAMLMYGHNPKRSEFDFEFGKRLYWFKLNVDDYHKAMDRISEEHPDLSPEELREQAMAESGGIRQIANCWPYPLYYQANLITDESWYYYRVEFPHDGAKIKNTFTSSQLSSSSEFKKRLLAIAPGAMYSGTNQMLDRALERQLYNIKRVETIDYVGYSKEHQAYVLGDIAVHNGKIFEINDEDYFDIGRLSVKTLSKSVDLEINNDRNEYDREWVGHLWQAFGAKGLTALTFWFGSLFSEQIRATHKSFPFLEIVGEAGAGKTTLIEFMWKLLGRDLYEGFDPSKSTAAARARNFAQVSGMPIVLIESDREQGTDQQPKVRAFDWDELKTAYNGRSVRSRGVATAGNETYEPPFRASIVISQNNAVQASEAIMTRIAHLYFDKSTHTAESNVATKKLEQMPISAVSGFILAATTREAAIMDLVNNKAEYYERQLRNMPEIKTARIAKNHGQILALADALKLVINLTQEQHKELHQQIINMAIEREQAIQQDHPVVQEFWDMYEYLNGDEEEPSLNHSRTEQEIAININHFIQVAADNRQQIPPVRDLKRLLKTSRKHKYLGQRVVNSAIKSRGLGIRSSSERCWVFLKGNSNG